MSNILTEWRQAVTAQLETNLQSGSFTVLAGERDGVSRDRKLACVFAPAMATDSGDVNFARPVLIVRAWVPQPKQPKNAAPQDPAPVEQLMLDLAVCLQAVQTPTLASALDGFYAFVTQIRPDYDDWGVEATLQGWTGNRAVRA